jgi:arginyl-tRNA synthetase
MVCQFSDVLDSVVKELLPNRLTDYLYRLAEKFHGFFHQCRVEGSEEQTSRLLLCEAVAQVLNQGIQLLGLKPLAKM